MTSDTHGGDFVSCSSFEKKEKLPRNSKKRQCVEKSRPNVVSPDPPPYTRHPPDFIVICRRFHDLLLLFFIVKQ